MIAGEVCARLPKGEAAWRSFAGTVGRDGEALPSAAIGPGTPAWLREVPAVEVLRRVRVQNFCRQDDEAGPSKPGKPHVLRGSATRSTSRRRARPGNST